MVCVRFNSLHSIVLGQFNSCLEVRNMIGASEENDNEEEEEEKRNTQTIDVRKLCKQE